MGYTIQAKRISKWAWALVVTFIIIILILVLMYAFQESPVQEMPPTEIEP